jgi:hypothetical protein
MNHEHCSPSSSPADAAGVHLLVAGAAVTLGVVAIATADVTSITPRPAVTTPAV